MTLLAPNSPTERVARARAIQAAIFSALDKMVPAVLSTPALLEKYRDLLIWHQREIAVGEMRRVQAALGIEDGEIEKVAQDARAKLVARQDALNQGERVAFAEEMARLDVAPSVARSVRNGYRKVFGAIPGMPEEAPGKAGCAVLLAGLSALAAAAMRWA